MWGRGGTLSSVLLLLPWREDLLQLHKDFFDKIVCFPHQFLIIIIHMTLLEKCHSCGMKIAQNDEHDRCLIHETSSPQKCIKKGLFAPKSLYESSHLEFSKWYNPLRKEPGLLHWFLCHYCNENLILEGQQTPRAVSESAINQNQPKSKYLSLLTAWLQKTGSDHMSEPLTKPDMTSLSSQYWLQISSKSPWCQDVVLCCWLSIWTWHSVSLGH